MAKNSYQCNMVEVFFIEQMKILRANMQKFSIRKLSFFFILSVFVFASVFSQENANRSLDAEQENLNKALHGLSVQYDFDNVQILSQTIFSKDFVFSLVGELRSQIKNITVSSSYDLSSKKFYLYVDDEICSKVTTSSVALLSSSLVDSNEDSISLVMSANYSVDTLKDVLCSSFSVGKSSKKYASEVTEDLRLLINIVYFDDKLEQHEELALNPTTVTSGTTANFRAKGGLGTYFWRLIVAENSNSKISTKTGTNVSYTAGSNVSRSFDVLFLSDGVEEVSLNLIVAMARLKSDGSGSKGGACFISRKYKD